MIAERAKELLGISTSVSGADAPRAPEEDVIVEDIVADAEVDAVGTVLNEPPATDDVMEHRSDPPPPGGITPQDR